MDKTVLNKLLTEFLSGVAFFGGGGAVVFIFRTLFVKAYDKWLETKVETHKGRVNLDNELRIADFKNKLELAAAERHLRHSRIFDKTAEIMAETYFRLLALKKAADDFTQLLPNHNHKDDADELKRNLNEFVQYFSPKRIYIPKKISEKIQLYYLTVRDAVFKFNLAEKLNTGQTRDPERYDKFMQEFLEASKQMPKLLESLEDDFQKYLGIQIEEKSADTGASKTTH